MDTITLSKQNRLFWLGRYSERVYSAIQLMIEDYDELIDGDGMDYRGYCRKMGIPCVYESGEDFFRRYLFDTESQFSIASSVEAMLGNGIVLRETISSQTLAYLQMAHSAMDMAARSESPGVELQWVMDDIMAFRGSFDDAVEEETARNIAKAGGTVERISQMLRLGHLEHLEQELRRLVNRLYKTDLPTNPEALQLITDQAMEIRSVERFELLRSVEGLFRV